ncbi:MAG: aminotransferase class I/II-fold pyridoxal phosphate-dependent enzyme [Actinomycetes bacterium]
MPDFDVDAIDLAELRTRRSAKWREFPPDVLPSWVAEMDFPLATPIATALRNAIDRSDTGYRSLLGLPQALSLFAARSWNWSVDPADVLVVPDVVSGLVHAVNVFTEPGDGVVINPPVYHPFFMVVDDVTHRTVVEVPMARADDGSYSLDLDALALAFARPDVTAYILCSPHNPSGSVPTRAELETISSLAEQHGVAVISDEIHAPLVMPGAQHVPYLTVAPDHARAVTVISASKAWNIPGLKCAQIATTPEVSAEFARRLPLEMSFGTGHFGVIAQIAAYMDGAEWLEQVVGILDGNRRLLTELLAARLPLAGYVTPQASYLAWLDLAAYGLGDDPAEVIRERAQLALSPGLSFGRQGRGFARLNFGTSPVLVAEIVDRLASVVQ